MCLIRESITCGTGFAINIYIAILYACGNMPL